MRFRTRTLGLLLVACLQLSGCKDKSRTLVEGNEELGQSEVESPLGSIAQLAEAGKEMQEKAKEMRERKPVDPVNYRSLVALMPEKAHWKSAGPPQGETSQMGDFKISNSAQTYERDGERMKITLVDGSYVPMVYAPFTMMSKFSREGTEGHTKGLEIKGEPAFEEWKKKSKRVTVTVLVEDRFLITFEGHGILPEDARAWAESFPIQRLSKWAREGMTGDDVLPPEDDSKTEEDADGKVAQAEDTRASPEVNPTQEEESDENPAKNGKHP